MLACHRWKDRTQVRIWKKKNTCYHPPLMCLCALEMLGKDKIFERLFSPRIQIKIKDGQVVQLPHKITENLLFIRVQVASVLCGDIAMKPSLPTALGNFNISKIFFNDKFCYIISGRKTRWNNTLKPSSHVI